jgi:hypothetical protein
MGVQIDKMGVTVTGQIVRKRDGDKTVLIVDEAQARELHAGTSTALAFFDQQAAQQTPPDPQLPLESPDSRFVTVDVPKAGK